MGPSSRAAVAIAGGSGGPGGSEGVGSEAASAAMQRALWGMMAGELRSGSITVSYLVLY